MIDNLTKMQDTPKTPLHGIPILCKWTKQSLVFSTIGSNIIKGSGRVAIISGSKKINDPFNIKKNLQKMANSSTFFWISDDGSSIFWFKDENFQILYLEI